VSLLERFPRAGEPLLSYWKVGEVFGIFEVLNTGNFLKELRIGTL